LSRNEVQKTEGEVLVEREKSEAIGKGEKESEYMERGGMFRWRAGPRVRSLSSGFRSIIKQTRKGFWGGG